MSKDLFLNRELSILEFNTRVLAEAMDPTNPLLERLKFTGIVSSNMDEFFMVRIASLADEDPMLDTIRQRAFRLMDEQNRHFREVLAPEMAAAGIGRMPMETCSPAQMDFLRTLFQKDILPLLTPIALEEDRPAPMLAGLRLFMSVMIAPPFQRALKKTAVVEIPSNLSRIIFLPTEKGHPFVLLEDVIATYAQELFTGYEILEKGFFRLTRGAEMTLDEEKDEDFMKIMSEALRQRREGDVMRMEIVASPDMMRFLQKHLNVIDADLYRQDGFFDLKGISQIAFQPGFEELKRPAWDSLPVPEFERQEDIWTVLKSKNVLMFTPYQSFDAVVRFLNAAADDPDVVVIKQTLYRTDKDSPIVRALERAAEKGKRVTVLVELKARFDEENNIGWAKRLSMAGATVLYGVAGLKTHAKACLVIRREAEGMKRYVHLATGNYNEKTSRIYSDVGFFTSEEDYANDLAAFFNMITGYSQPAAWSKIEVAPFGLRQKLLRLIRRETLRSTPEHPGQILMKMNSLIDSEMIEALYAASQAGVHIKLNVRGICGLRPGLKNMSETIEVISIVDQFLEHSRIFYFANGGEPEVYLSSADCMPRNLDRRVELLFPIEDVKNKKELIDVLHFYFRDNVKAWRLQPDGSYKRVEAEGRRKFRVQEALCERAQADAATIRKIVPKELTPQKPKVPTE